MVDDGDKWARDNGQWRAKMVDGLMEDGRWLMMVMDGG